MGPSDYNPERQERMGPGPEPRSLEAPPGAEAKGSQVSISFALNGRDLGSALRTSPNFPVFAVTYKYLRVSRLRD